MKRGELYRVRNPAGEDPRRSRVVLVVGRDAVIQSRYRTVMCVPVFSSYDALPTQVAVDEQAGLRYPSALHCDNVISLSKASLTDYVGSLAPDKLAEVNRALAVALALDEPI